MRPMAVPLATDTSPDIESRQVAAWRAMTPAAKAEAIAALTTLTQEMALAGVRARYPGRSDREHFLRLAIVNLGLELASQAYPEIATLDRP